ncbi:MAG: hypothetical protein WCX88_04055 [Patescibacteria group bacterium]
MKVGELKEWFILQSIPDNAEIFDDCGRSIEVSYFDKNKNEISLAATKIFFTPEEAHDSGRHDVFKKYDEDIKSNKDT